MATIVFNGQSQTLSTPMSVMDLIQSLGFDPRLGALEYNGAILHRQEWSQTQVQEGDHFEFITMVGGG